MKDYVKEFNDIVLDDSSCDGEIISAAGRIIREAQKELSYDKNIILWDEDADESYAIVKTNENVDTIRKVIDGVKTSLPGEWSFDDIKEGLINSGLDLSVEEGVRIISY